MIAPQPPRQLHPTSPPRARYPLPRGLVALFRDQARRERHLIESAALPSLRPDLLYLCVHEEVRRRRAQAYLRLLDDHEDDAVALAAEILASRRRAAVAAEVAS